MVDGVFAAQARAEAETLQAVRGRALAAEHSEALIRALHASLGAIMSGVGMSHPSFALVARELSPEGAAKLGIA